MNELGRFRVRDGGAELLLMGWDYHDHLAQAATGKTETAISPNVCPGLLFSGTNSHERKG